LPGNEQPLDAVTGELRYLATDRAKQIRRPLAKMEPIRLVRTLRVEPSYGW